MKDFNNLAAKKWFKYSVALTDWVDFKATNGPVGRFYLPQRLTLVEPIPYLQTQPITKFFAANMTKKSLLTPIAYFVALVVVCASVGCEQQRYSHSEWAPAINSNGTLPGVGQLGEGAAGSLPMRTGTLPNRNSIGTMPNRNLVSLPWRGGNQTSLPERPQVVVARPQKKVKPPLPSLDGKPVWDVTEKRQMRRVPGKPGLYLGDGNTIIGLTGSTFQQNGSRSTLPGRGNGSTLPFRGSRFGASTLPNR